jgi:hypothetical protein
MRLGNEWNARWQWRKETCFAPENYVVHLAGFRPHGARVAVLKAEASRWGDSLSRFLTHSPLELLRAVGAI